MTSVLRSGRGLTIGLAAIGILAAARAVNAQPQVAPATPAAQSSAAAPGAGAKFEVKLAPGQESYEKFRAVMQAQPGGIRPDDVARRATATSPELAAKQSAVEQAAAKVDQAAVNFAPRLSFLARYMRLSTFTMPSLGNVVGTANLDPIVAICPPSDGTKAVTCQVNAAAGALTFPLILNQYTVQGSLAIPLSDYILRISQNYAAQTKNQEAAVLQERATRAKIELDAKSYYYNWGRARGAVVVVEQGLVTAKLHLKDVGTAMQVGTASKADMMRVESQVAATELMVERTKNLLTLSEEAIRTMMHVPPTVALEPGEDLLQEAPDRPMEQLGDLYAEAYEKRLELRSIDMSVASLNKMRQVVQAGYLPRIDGVADAYYQNPNQRFPFVAGWASTWDVGIQLSWTINDTFSAIPQVNEIGAKIAEIEHQRDLMKDGLRMEIVQAHNHLREAQVAVLTTRRQLAASEESYRVRRELFRAGKAISAELTDAESDLVHTRLDTLNAIMDLKIGLLALDHSIGRDVDSTPYRKPAKSPTSPATEEN